MTILSKMKDEFDAFKSRLKPIEIWGITEEKEWKFEYC